MPFQSKTVPGTPGMSGFSDCLFKVINLYPYSPSYPRCQGSVKLGGIWTSTACLT